MAKHIGASANVRTFLEKGRVTYSTFRKYTLCKRRGLTNVHLPLIKRRQQFALSGERMWERRTRAVWVPVWRNDNVQESSAHKAPDKKKKKKKEKQPRMMWIPVLHSCQLRVEADISEVLTGTEWSLDPPTSGWAVCALWAEAAPTGEWNENETWAETQGYANEHVTMSMMLQTNRTKRAGKHFWTTQAFCFQVQRQLM